MTSRGQFQRSERLAGAIQEVVAAEVEKLRDPRIGFVTITGVALTPEFERATVYYTTLGDDEAKAATGAGLRSAAGLLRTAVGQQVRMKHTPELRFEEDSAFESAQRIEAILRDIATTSPQSDEGGAPLIQGEP
jgi:ribosome-binding factor A